MFNITERARRKYQQGLDKRKISGDARLRINFGGIG